VHLFLVSAVAFPCQSCPKFTVLSKKGVKFILHIKGEIRERCLSHSQWHKQGGPQPQWQSHCESGQLSTCSKVSTPTHRDARTSISCPTRSPTVYWHIASDLPMASVSAQHSCTPTPASRSRKPQVVLRSNGRPQKKTSVPLERVWWRRLESGQVAMVDICRCPKSCHLYTPDWSPIGVLCKHIHSIGGALNS
jgi:hypothetical protein